MRIGFVGFPLPRHQLMAQRLLDVEHDIYVHDVERDRASKLLNLGARWANSPRILAQQCSLIFIALLQPERAEEVICGENGILAGAASRTVLCDMTIGDPETSRKLAKQSIDREVFYLDTPVTGGFAGRKDAEILMFVGGNYEVAESCKEIFKLMVTDFVHVGEVGLAVTVKLIHEHIILSFGTIIDEAIVLGEKSGIPGFRLFELLKAAVAGPLVIAGIATGMHNKLTIEAEKTGSLSISAASLLLLVDVATRLGIDAPLASAAAEVYRTTLAEGYTDNALSTLARYRKNAGLLDGISAAVSSELRAP